MSESKQAWYQNGTVMLVIAGIVLYVLGTWAKWHQESIPLCSPEIAGRINQPILGNPSFELYLWHQHPGNLHRGQLIVSVSGSSVLGNGNEPHKFTSVHSFELWEPNEANQVTISVPLSESDPTAELSVAILLQAEEIKLTRSTSVWDGDGWKRPSPPASGTVD